MSQPRRRGSLSSEQTLLRALLRSRLVTAFLSVALLIFLGSAGYWFLGHLHYDGVLTPTTDHPWSALDCLYMTVITVSTIGYGEVLPIGNLPLVRIYTILLVLTSMILVAYSVSSATAFLVDGDLQRLLLRRRNMREIARLRGHHIVCGCGVTGRVIIDELISLGMRVVVIDIDPERLDPVREIRGVLTIQGDATLDEVLLEAGVEQAAGLAATLRDDKDNLFVIISVRQLNPAIRIVSQASATGVQAKLLRAGANGAVASSHVGGLRLVSELVRPAVVNFLDLMLRHRDSPVRFAEVEVGPEWEGRTLGELSVERRIGLPVLALHSGANACEFNPGPEVTLRAGARLITMGPLEQVTALERLVGDRDGAEYIYAGDDPEPLPEVDPVGDL